MTVISIHITVAPGGAVFMSIPLPAGEYEAAITVDDQPVRQLPTLPFDVDALPVHDLGPWPEGLSLRREDMYGDDGR